MERWGSLYLAACTLLGDENLAGDLVLRARDPEHLADLLRQHGELPQRLPQPSDEVLDHVAYLRRRAQRRRLLTGLWTSTALAAVLAVVVGLVFWPGQTGAATSVFRSPALVESTRGEFTLKVHRAEASAEGVTIWWSLGGPGVGLRKELPGASVSLYDRWLPVDAIADSVQPVNRDLIHGKTLVAELMDRPAEALLSLGFEEYRFMVGFPVDRSPLRQAEQRYPVAQVLQTGGVGVRVLALVRGPGYTYVEYEPFEEAGTPFDLIAFPLIESMVVDQGSVAIRDRQIRPYRFGPLPAEATQVRLGVAGPLRVVTGLLLPLREGEFEPHTGLLVQSVRREGESAFRVSLKYDGPVVGLETVALERADSRSLGTFRLGFNISGVSRSGDGITFTVTVTEGAPVEGQSDLYLRLHTVWLAPPGELQVPL